MGKRASAIEWIVAQDDAEWERLCPPLPPENTTEKTSAFYNRPLAKRLLGSILIFLLLATTSGWRWGTAQAGLQRSAEEAHMPAALTFQASMPDAGPQTARPHPGEWFRHAREVRDVYASIQSATSDTDPDLVVRSIDVQGDRSVVRFVAPAKGGEPTFRQTRFYQRTDKGWQPAAPDVDLWGPARRLETPSFVFHFRQNDAMAVIEAASRLEAIYATLRRDFGVESIPNAEKPIIEVSVTQPAGRELWFIAPERIVVASPAVYHAPTAVTDTELLAQSLALPLLHAVLAQSSRRYTPDTHWEPLLDALNLWELWDMDLPLAIWQDGIVKWIYGDVSSLIPGKTPALPGHYQELCAAHTLWLLYPVQIGVPLTCSGAKHEAEYLAEWRLLAPPARLDQFALPVSIDPYVEAASRAHQKPYPGQTVVLATLIDYAVATHGRERLPKLIAALDQHKTWETLLPEVFGVSAAEFEAGWQDYLMERYDVD